MIEYLFELIESGVSEEEAIKKTVLKYHKYELFGKGIPDSIEILKKMYYGESESH